MKLVSKAGVQAVNPKATVEIQYAESFSDGAKAKSLAEAMYASDVDIIYAAAGGAGLGVFAAAKSIVEANPDRKIWVIGVRPRPNKQKGKSKRLS